MTRQNDSFWKLHLKKAPTDEELKALFGDTPLYHLIIESLNSINSNILNLGLPALAASFNGGKDCTVLLQLLHWAILRWESRDDSISKQGSVGVGRLPILYFPETDPFPEVTAFIKETEQIYGLKIENGGHDFKTGLGHFLVKHPKVKGIFIGVRRGDPFSDDLKDSAPSSPGWPSHRRLFSILHWSYSDVWSFILTIGLPYCSLYDEGYTSLGGMESTIKNPHLFSEEAQTHSPAHSLENDRYERASRVKH
eukprot:GCRY01001337.1.p1 GENE.GCRY01001337.1~~GCRY01001337.1.p1  ORF type:complete len:252 (+),score=19.73 GCRY01001337.1:275-1030(+)